MEASRRSRFQRASLALLLIRLWARRWSSLLAEFIGGFEESRRNFSRSVGIETRWLRLWERKGRGRERERGRGKGRVEVLGTVVLAHLHYPRPGPKGIRVYNGRTVLRLDQLAYQTSWYECAKNETKQSKDAWTRFYEKNPSPFHGEIRARVPIFCTKKDIADLTKTPAILIISSRLGFEGEERIWINTMNGMSNKRILNNIFHFERERNRRVFWILQEK